MRKGSAAAHYIMGGPTANRHNAFTVGTAATEIYVMHGETAAAARLARSLDRLAKFTEPQRSLMRDALAAARRDVRSADVIEVLDRALAST